MATVVGANITVTDQAATPGVYTFDVTKNFSAGDNVDIGGTKYTAREAGKGSGAAGALTANEFLLGTDSKASVKNLVDTITTNDAKYTAAQKDTTFFTGNRVELTEKVASGTDLTSVKGGNPSSQLGEYDFKISENLGAGDVIKIDGKMLMAGASAGLAGDFPIGANPTATAANIADAITNADSKSSQALQDLKAKYTVTATGDQLTFKEITASGKDLVNADLSIGKNTDGRTVSTTATPQSYEITAQTLDAGSKVKIGNAEITLTKKGTAAMVAQELKSQIDAATALSTSSAELKALNTNYTATVNGDKLTLTQKTATAGETAIKASFETTEYNGFTADLQIGANTGQTMSLSVNDMRATALKVSGDSIEGGTEVTARDGAKATYVSTANVTNGSNNKETEFALDVSSNEKATAAISVINDAIESVSAERSKLGAYQNRLEHTINNLSTSSENLTAAESRVRDTDMAKTVMDNTKNGILAQAAQAMLAQANQAPQQVLQLLR